MLLFPLCLSTLFVYYTRNLHFCKGNMKLSNTYNCIWYSFPVLLTTDMISVGVNVKGRQHQSLHEVACHAYLFLPETSCERGNKYLDRSVLASRVDRTELASF